MKELDKLNQRTESHGALRPGQGLLTGVIVLSLAILCFLGVLAFIGLDWFILDLLGLTLIFMPNGFFRPLAFPFRWKG